jgi:hypothetical protein
MVLAVSLWVTEMHAQTAEEFFRQRQTKRKYALLEIAQWKIYATYLSKGISIARKGLNTIEQLKSGNWKLDANFFDHLLKPGNAIKQFARLGELKKYPQYINDQKQQLISYMQQHHYSQAEINYISSVMKKLLLECQSTLQQLEQITAKDQVQLSDDQRITRIAALKEEMKQQVSYTRKIVNEVKIIQQ